MNYPFRNAAVAFARGEDASAVGEQIMSICENYPKPALDCAMIPSAVLPPLQANPPMAATVTGRASA